MNKIDILNIETGEIISINSNKFDELIHNNLIVWNNVYNYHIILDKFFKNKPKIFYTYYIDRYVKIHDNCSLLNDKSNPRDKIGKIIRLTTTQNNNEIIRELDFIFIVKWENDNINLYRMSDLYLYN